MHHMVTCLIIAVPVGLAGSQIAFQGNAGQPQSKKTWELTPPGPDALPIDANQRLPGQYFVGSRIKDEQALGGFGPCDNWPKDLGAKELGVKSAVSLVAYPDEPVAYANHRGIALRLINRTDKVVAFSACDSQLYIVQEALDKDGRWREIETMPTTDCGNSFHRVLLGPGQYWEMKARTYSGPIKTKIRFRLDPNRSQEGVKSIYSNEFEGQVSPAQFRQEANAGRR